MKLHKMLSIALSLLLMLGLVSCGSKAKEPTQEQVARRDELAQAFMGEIRDKILPIRNQPLLIGALGILVSENEVVEDFTLLEAFREDCEAGRDCSLTICFITNSFVVARLEMVRGTGYYFRYQYSAKDPIAVTPKVFDNITWTTEDGKTRLKLEYDKNELVTFTFKEKPEEGMPPDPE